MSAFLLIFHVFREHLLFLLAPTMDFTLFEQSWLLVFYAYFSLRVVSELGQTFFLSIMRPKITLFVSLMQATISGPLLIIFVPQWGLLGVALALFISFGTSAFIYFVLILCVSFERRSIDEI